VEKGGNQHHNKNPAKGNISSTPSLRNTAGTPGKKNLKTQLQGHKGLKP
jgi:hypothetical protein